jgi:hypothetical protein
MATLRIIFTTTNNQFIPTFYSLQGVGEDPTENTYYYRPARVVTNMYLGSTGTIYCYRKIDFSGMVDNEVKSVKGLGTKIKITTHGTTDLTPGALQCLGWGCSLLCNLNNQYMLKQKLPQYILVDDLTQLNENIYFHILWSDNNSIQKHSNDATKFVDITLNLFVNND